MTILAKKCRSLGSPSQQGIDKKRDESESVKNLHIMVNKDYLAPVQLGSFSSSGLSFYPGPRTPQPVPFDWLQCEVRTFERAPGEAPVCVYLLRDTIRAITSAKPLRIAKSAGGPPPPAGGMASATFRLSSPSLGTRKVGLSSRRAGSRPS
jgi:hypothetical protein